MFPTRLKFFPKLALRYFFSRVTLPLHSSCFSIMSSQHKTSEIIVDKVVPLQTGQSKYVKPLRMHFSQNGVHRTWDCMKVHDSVSIVLYNKTRGKLIFVKQFRPAVFLASSFEDPESQKRKDTTVSGYTLELCAGIIDKEGKTPAEIAQEEILEEVGYQVDVSSLNFLASFRSGVGVTGSLQYSFFCEVEDKQKVSKGGGIGDEQIEVIELSPEEAVKLLWTRDEEALESRPASMLLSLSWFIYEYMPKLSKSIN